MKSEQEIKERVTPEIIKQMCELAEGFEFDAKMDHVLFGDGDRINIENLFDYVLMVSTLIRRAADAINLNDLYAYILEILPHVLIYGENKYRFKNYQLDTLTVVELAMLDCLIDILEER